MVKLTDYTSLAIPERRRVRRLLRYVQEKLDLWRLMAANGEFPQYRRPLLPENEFEEGILMGANGLPVRLVYFERGELENKLMPGK